MTMTLSDVSQLIVTRGNSSNRYVVDLLKRQYSCSFFEQFHLPCCQVCLLCPYILHLEQNLGVFTNANFDPSVLLLSRAFFLGRPALFRNAGAFMSRNLIKSVVGRQIDVAECDEINDCFKYSWFE